jgi:DNA polymerase elongation subunit (family B)
LKRIKKKYKSLFIYDNVDKREERRGEERRGDLCLKKRPGNYERARVCVFYVNFFSLQII